MARSFYLGTDAELYAGSQAFSTKISASPTSFGLVAAQATSYASLNAAWGTAYLLAVDPETRTKGAIAAKNQARANLRKMASDLAKIIDGTATVTDAQRLDLGLNVRATPAPIPAPSQAPNLDVAGRSGTTVTIKLHDGSASRRRKPAGVQGAAVFSHVGATPPADLANWKFEGNTTRTKVDVQFDAALAPGTLVWLCAFWFNPRAQSGPGCTPVSAILAGGGMQMAA
jgi:hypothetical protein